MAPHQQQVPPSEIVFVDGGSTDGTLEVLRTLQGSQTEDSLGEPAKSVAVLRTVHRQDASIPDAVNAAVRATHGNVIVRLDAHSKPSLDYIARALARLANERPGGGRVACSARR